MPLTPEQIEAEKNRLNTEIAQRQATLAALTLLSENKAKLSQADTLIFGYREQTDGEGNPVERPKINIFNISLDLPSGEKMVCFITIDGVRHRFDSGGDWQDRLYGAIEYMLNDAKATIEADETQLLQSL